MPYRPAAGLTVNPEKVCFIIVKAREFDAKEAVVEPEPGSNPTDDADVEILEDYPDDPTLQELLDAIDGLNEDEQVELVALAWLGRGDFDRKEWRDAVRLARERHTGTTARYLAGTRCSGTISRKGSRSSASPVRTSRSTGSERRAFARAERFDKTSVEGHETGPPSPARTSPGPEDPRACP